MRATATFGLVLVIFSVIPRAFGQTPQAPQAPSSEARSSIVAAIHATGSHIYNEEQIAASCGLKPGDAVTRESIEAATDRLLELGVFTRVSYRFTSLDNKVTVSFAVDDAPAFPVSFDNFPWFTDERIAAAIRDAVPLYNGTAPKEGALVDAVASAIGGLLSDRKIPGTVEHTLSAEPSAEPRSPLDARLTADAHERAQPMMMQFRVEGLNVTIGSLSYGDTLAQNSPKLRDRTSDLIGKPYSRLAIQTFEAEQILPLYLATAHLRVKFGEPSATFPKDHGPSESSKLDVALPIEAGPAFHLSEIAFSGQTAADEPALRACIFIKSGEAADGMRMAAGWRCIEREYRRRGHIDESIDPQPRFDDNAEFVSYRVAIQPGPQYLMGSLVVTGLAPDAERQLRQIWRTRPGEEFDENYFDDMLAKLEKPNREIFAQMPVHYTELGHWLRPDMKARTVDVLLDFK